MVEKEEDAGALITSKKKKRTRLKFDHDEESMNKKNFYRDLFIKVSESLEKLFTIFFTMIALNNFDDFFIFSDTFQL